jgi:hypothetical protein
MTIFAAVQAIVRFFVRAFYTLGAHIVLMLTAFVCMLLFDLIGTSGRNAMEIGLWEYFWLAFSFPVPFLGYALWLCWLFNLMPEQMQSMFVYPWWARKIKKL